MNLPVHRYALYTVIALSAAACAAEPVSEDAAADDADLVTQGAVVDGHLKLDETCVDTKSIEAPWGYAGRSCDDIVVPVTFTSSSEKHAWDIELTGEARIHLVTQSIKVEKGGKPDLDGYATRNLPGVSYVPDVDTVLSLYKKVGNGWKLVGTSDDGVSESKGSYLERKGAKGTVFRAVIKTRNAAANTHIGLFIQSESTTPPFNEDS